MQVEDEYRHNLDDPEEMKTGIVKRSLDVIENRLKFFMNKLQNATRQGSAAVEKHRKKKERMDGEILSRIRFV